MTSQNLSLKPASPRTPMLDRSLSQKSSDGWLGVPA